MRKTMLIVIAVLLFGAGISYSQQTGIEKSDRLEIGFVFMTADMPQQAISRVITVDKETVPGMVAGFQHQIKHSDNIYLVPGISFMKFFAKDKRNVIPGATPKDYTGEQTTSFNIFNVQFDFDVRYNVQRKIRPYFLGAGLNASYLYFKTEFSDENPDNEDFSSDDNGFKVGGTFFAGVYVNKSTELELRGNVLPDYIFSRISLKIKL